MASKTFINNLIKTNNINVTIHDNTCYNDVFRKGSLGLGESYIEGKWDSNEKLDEVFTKIGKASLGNKLAEQSWYIKIWLFFQWVYNMFSWQTLSSSKVVVDQHYNLDNRLYSNMLSSDMMYSCAYFPLDDMNLHDAQLAKLDLIAKKLHFRPGMKVLDIGCGWGFACNYFSNKYGIEIFGITLSEEQFKYAKEKYHADFYLTDYRNIPYTFPEKSFDAIYSIGMFEHVTPKHYTEFMNICFRMLKPAGLFLLHTIGSNTTKTINDRFLDKYIFPNSILPSLALISKSSEHLFIIEDVHNFGRHYDKTLMMWYDNFINNIDKLDFLSDKFKRMWSYYLLSCAGTFRSKGCQLYQVVLSKQRYEHYERPTL